MSENQTKDALRVKASESVFGNPTVGVLFNIPTTEKLSSASIRYSPSNLSSCLSMWMVCFVSVFMNCPERSQTPGCKWRNYKVLFLLHMATSLLILMSWEEVSISVQDYFYLH